MGHCLGPMGTPQCGVTRGENVVQNEEMELLNDNITRAYHEYKSILPPTDSHFFSYFLEILLKQRRKVKEVWLKQVTTAKGRAIRRQMQCFTTGRGRVEVHQMSLSHMQQRTRQWLNLAR
jgi:hypothetical protein